MGPPPRASSTSTNRTPSPPAPQRVRTASAPTPSGAGRPMALGSIARRKRPAPASSRARRTRPSCVVNPPGRGSGPSERVGAPNHLRLRVGQVHSGQPKQAAGDLSGVGPAVAQIDPPEPGEVAGGGRAAAPAALRSRSTASRDAGATSRRVGGSPRASSTASSRLGPARGAAGRRPGPGGGRDRRRGRGRRRRSRWARRRRSRAGRGRGPGAGSSQRSSPLGKSGGGAPEYHRPALAGWAGGVPRRRLIAVSTGR